MLEQDLFSPGTFDNLKEKCAVYAVYGEGLNAARLTVFGLEELQHRGQDSAGIAASNGFEVRTHRGMGLVSHVFDKEDTVTYLEGHMAIGHNRYRTSGSVSEIYAQPVFRPTENLALGHNGNLSDDEELRLFLDNHGIATDTLNDTGLMFEAIRHYKKHGSSLGQAVEASYPLLVGATSVVVMDEKEIVAFRDPKGIRPLSYGRYHSGFVVSSETCAFPEGTIDIKDIEPGEMITINEHGVEAIQLADGDQKLDIFEMLYFSRPDSVLLGKRLQIVRENLGRQLALEHPVFADVVIGVPNSGTPAAQGYAAQSRIPLVQGLLKNPYSSRTFIEPDQSQRAHKAERKYKIISEHVAGKIVSVVDDSIVRGTTTPRVVAKLRRAGARGVNVLSAAGQIKHPDYFGVDIATKQELISNRFTPSQMALEFGADYVGFISLDGMYKGIGLPRHLFTDHQFTGEYPVRVRELAGSERIIYRVKNMQAVVV